jgi:Uma2 family endonuclease
LLIQSILATGTIYGAPTLVVEILSPGVKNIDRDRRLKLKLYAKFGVDEYRIVDPHEPAIEVYRREGEFLKLFTTFTGDEIITTPVLPGFGCAVKSFF